MLKRIVHFVQYHNFFTIAVMFVFLGASATLAANPEAVIQKSETVRSVDNTFVVNTDFDTYDMGLKINTVTEDADRYYVEYTYNTAEVVDYVWQPVPKSESIKVSKKELAGRDLGVYVAEQLGQMVTGQIAFLKEFQEREKKNGATPKVVAVEYSGLVGRFLGPEEKSFEGYTPVKTPQPVQEKIAYEEIAAAAAAAANGVSTVSYGAPPGTAPGTAPGSAKLVTESEMQALIQSAVKKLLTNQASSTPETIDTGAVNDTTAPVIALSGSNPVYVPVGGTFTEPGITATDDSGGSVSYTYFLDGFEVPEISVDTSVKGNHIITYRATDAAGNSSTKTRSVIVDTPPEGTSETPTPTETASTTPSTPPEETTPPAEDTATTTEPVVTEPQPKPVQTEQPAPTETATTTEPAP